MASILLLLPWGRAFGQPIVKTGPCPALTRYNAPAGENWAQFPVEPNPASQFPVNTLQNPLTPAQSINCIEVPAGLKVELWASEQTPGKIAYLQHFTFDERGRLWAVEPRSYPNIIRPASGNINDQKFTGGNDRIVILEDTDGDRVMDSFKVFREGLNMPQSIEVATGTYGRVPARRTRMAGSLPEPRRFPASSSIPRGFFPGNTGVGSPSAAKERASYATRTAWWCP